MDLINILILRGLVPFFNLFPLGMRETVIYLILRLFFGFASSYRNISHRNLKQVFPEKTDAERQKILIRSYHTLARTIVDVLRAHLLTDEWFETHVHYPDCQRHQELYSEGKGLVLITGHLGSFEILGNVFPHFGIPLTVVMRSLRMPRVDEWIAQSRESHGNQVISQKGAVKKVIKTMKSGGAIGILFDQNVTRNNGTFIDWFGHPASTTITPGYLVVTTGCAAAVVSLCPTTGDNYEVLSAEIDGKEILARTDLSREEKIHEVTILMVRAFEKMVRDRPDGWFWMHRRWKTTSDASIPEDFYTRAIGN